MTKQAKKTTAHGKETAEQRKARVAVIVAKLRVKYPHPKTALNWTTPLELLVATILSAQTTDAGVNIATVKLFKKYHSAKDYAAANPAEVEELIHSTGFFRQKSKTLIKAGQMLVDKFGGKVPDTMDALLELPGVARKTANVVLGSWFKKAVGVVVDTHVHRISRRLELTTQDDPQKIEQDLMRVIPQEKWILFSHQIIWHGRSLCVARKPKCADCPLENLCHAADKTWSTVELHQNAKA